MKTFTEFLTLRQTQPLVYEVAVMLTDLGIDTKVLAEDLTLAMINSGGEMLKEDWQGALSRGWNAVNPMNWGNPERRAGANAVSNMHQSDREQARAQQQQQRLAAQQAAQQARQQGQERAGAARQQGVQAHQTAQRNQAIQKAMADVNALFADLQKIFPDRNLNAEKLLKWLQAQIQQVAQNPGANVPRPGSGPGGPPAQNAQGQRPGVKSWAPTSEHRV